MSANFRAPDRDIPAAIQSIRKQPYQPLSYQSQLLIDTRGIYHSNNGCSTDLQPVSQPPTVGIWIGIDEGFCYCIKVPDEVSRARQLLRIAYQLPTPLPVSDPLTPGSVGKHAQRLMRLRRQLDTFSKLLGTIPRYSNSMLDQAVSNASSDLNEKMCLDAEILAEALQDFKLKDIFKSLFTDSVEVLAAFDNYQMHDEQSASIDGDITDVAAKAFRVAENGERIAVLAPRSLVRYMAIHRKSGGYTEAAEESNLHQSLIETALVLWDPDSPSEYNRWSVSLSAAKRLQ